MERPGGEYVEIAVARPVRGLFTYRVPPGWPGPLQLGQRVKVPFGRGSALGFVVGHVAGVAHELEGRVKPLLELLEPAPALPADVVELARFAAQHYRSPLGEALKAALPPGLSRAAVPHEPAPDVEVFVRASARVLAGGDLARQSELLASLARSPAQQAVLSYILAVGGRAPLEEVAHAIPGARVHVKKLAARGLVELDELVLQPGVQPGLSADRPAALTADQASAVEVLREALLARRFEPFLLHGVTGSGKTEVYLRVVERALELGRGALVLVPEIALTPQLVGRFRSRFGGEVAVLHSALKDRERLLAWQRLKDGELHIAVGVRSAVWAPVADLGVVVVDEEHDPSFKQEEKLRYHARDLAVVRAQRASAVVILGSATPSLESLDNVRRGRYRLLELPRRVDGRPMPRVSLVDLKVERPRTPEVQDLELPLLSATLRAAIARTLDRGQQVILFLNRRGYTTFLTCEVCGQSLRCEDCDVSLTRHLSARRLQCHYCGRAYPRPTSCPSCGGPLLELGAGTERIEAEVADAFPAARVARLDRDAASSAEALTDLLASFARREIDILVGTQMVAKGHDFPGVTLVAVVLADGALALPDFRAAERTFQLLTQVAGRAGRGQDPGEVLVQSYHPQSPAVARMLAEDFPGFVADELARRRALAWPPYSRLAAIRVEGKDAALTARTAAGVSQAVSRRLAASAAVRVLGPAPAPVSRVKGNTRWQLVLKGPSHAALAPLLDAVEAYARTEAPPSVSVIIDVDPVAML